MNGLTLQDRLYRAAGRTAAIAGSTCDLYRPSGTDTPLHPSHRILRLQAAFLPQGGRLTRAVPSSEPYWEGVFDAAYTNPGDILHRRSDGAIFFIAAQQPMLPVLCVRALRMVDFARPASATVAGLNIYGGTVTATDTQLARAWPASILASGGSGTGAADIQAGLSPNAWQVLLPVSLNLRLLAGDRLTDDQGQAGIIANAERTDLGWRLAVKQAST